MHIILILILILQIASSTPNLNNETPLKQPTVKLIQRDSIPLFSFYKGTSQYQQIFRPSWVQPTESNGFRKGLLMRVQNCDMVEGKCLFCGGVRQQSSLIVFAQEIDGKFEHATAQHITFAPFLLSQKRGTEDPRVVFNPHDKYYYMTYETANGINVDLNIAKTKDPFDRHRWIKIGPSFPEKNFWSKGSLFFDSEGQAYLLWNKNSGDLYISKTDNIQKWKSNFKIVLSDRPGMFDSRIEPGGSPIKLSNGNYLYFYNGIEDGWYGDYSKNRSIGWAILDGKDPTKVIARAKEPLLKPMYPWQKGLFPYNCNVPNSVFAGSVQDLGNNRFRLFYGGGDLAVGSAIVEIVY